MLWRVSGGCGGAVELRRVYTFLSWWLCYGVVWVLRSVSGGCGVMWECVAACVCTRTMEGRPLSIVAANSSVSLVMSA